MERIIIDGLAVLVLVTLPAVPLLLIVAAYDIGRAAVAALRGAAKRGAL